MKIGDLVTFCPEVWGIPLEDRPIGVITNVGHKSSLSDQMVTALFFDCDVPYSSKAEEFEVVNEDW